jgi:hypothetical protein
MHVRYVCVYVSMQGNIYEIKLRSHVLLASLYVCMYLCMYLRHNPRIQMILLPAKATRTLHKRDTHTHTNGRMIGMSLHLQPTCNIDSADEKSYSMPYMTCTRAGFEHEINYDPEA